MVITSIIAVIAVLSVAQAVSTRNKAQAEYCRANLRDINYAMLSYREVFKSFPSERSRQGISSLANQEAYAAFCVLTQAPYNIDPRQAICPADSRPPAGTTAIIRNYNLSYFVSVRGTNSEETAFILGDRNLSALPGSIALKRDSLAVWHPDVGLHGRKGNILLGSGRCVFADNKELNLQIKRLDNITNILLIP